MRFSVSAGLVFYVTAGFAGMSGGLVYLWGQRFLALSIIGAVLALSVLIIDERTGFTNSRRLRRIGERRINFNKVEVVILFGLLMLEVYVSVLAWLR